MSDIHTYLVVGLGVSGQSVVDLLSARNQRVVTVDDGKPADYRLADISTPDFDFSIFDAVITSPGFKPTSAFIVSARHAGIPVISDVELAWQLHQADPDTSQQQWIGITGTNGKTTTTEMTTAIMNYEGKNSQAVGNIGNPILYAATDSQVDSVVAELSSFQMHYTDSLELDCAAITNLADDHLDWHGGFDNYASDKAKVYARAKKAIIYNADDERVTQLAHRAYKESVGSSCSIVGFTLGIPTENMIGVCDGWIVNRTSLSDVQGRIAPISELTHLREDDSTVYPHLLADALCAIALAMGAGVDPRKAVDALREFAPSGHRIQTVAVAHMSNSLSDQNNSSAIVRFVDDSKATNAHAAAASLSSYADKSVIWIAGGLAKGARFDDLIAQQKHIIKSAVIIGVDQEPLLEAFARYAPEIPLTIIAPHISDSRIDTARSCSIVSETSHQLSDRDSLVDTSMPIMQQAVYSAMQYAQPGDTVLMAPACASMDQFISYADRGNQFAQYAQQWVQEHE